MTPTRFLTYAFAVLVVITQALILIMLLTFIAKNTLKRKYSKKLEHLNSRMRSMMSSKALLFGFVVSLTATLGSLYYSEIAHYDPCRLCWFQRIFMYPQSIIFGIALLKKDRHIFRYTIPFSLMGILIASYHYYLQVSPETSSSCSAYGVSCAASPFFTFGYITIPMMAWTAFLILLLCSIAGKYQTDV